MALCRALFGSSWWFMSWLVLISSDSCHGLWWFMSWFMVVHVMVFIILSSCENWLSGTAKILLQLDSLNQYDCFELQHQYVSINIKEVMSIQRFLHFT